MADTAVLTNVYNHYLTSYAPRGTGKYDTHKKSELRSIYNSIVKQNKEAPLFITDTSKESQQYAVGIKENARDLRNTIASLGGLNEEELLSKKKAFSSNENIATAGFVGETKEDAPTFEIEVRNLAKPQINLGNFLPSNEVVGKPADTYSFDVHVNDMNYEFQFNVKENETNLQLQKKLANLINNSNISLEVDVVDDDEGNSALRVKSNLTGLPENKSSLFDISDEKTSKNSGMVDYLGLREITRPAENAQFLINGNEKTSLSNHFTVEKTYEINLTGVSPEEGMTATIGTKTDTESLKENIVQLVGSYNDFMKTANEYLEKQANGNKLVGEMNRIGRYYNEGLARLGLEIGEDGSISVDEKKLDEAASAEDASELLTPVKNFTNSLLRKSNQVSLNPMNYVAKTVVAYKNPGHNFVAPYATSAYSGMMFNSYC